MLFGTVTIYVCDNLRITYGCRDWQLQPICQFKKKQKLGNIIKFVENSLFFKADIKIFKP